MNKVLLTASVILMTAGFSHAQLKDIMLKKAGEKLNKKSESSSTNTSTNTTTPTTSESNTNSTEATPENKNSSPAFSFGGGKKEIRPVYTFSQNVLFEMKSYDKKGNLEEKKNTKMRVHLSKEPYNGTEIYDDKDKSVGFSIFEADKEQSVMLMDNDGSKMAMVTKINSEKVGEKAAEEQNKDNVKITKTGRTKTICNHLCSEYLATDDKGSKTEMWVAEKTELQLSGAYSMFSGQNKKFASKFENAKDYPQGIMLQMINYQTNGERFEMTAVEVNVSAPKTVETAGYTVY